MRTTTVDRDGRGRVWRNRDGLMACLGFIWRLGCFVFT